MTVRAYKLGALGQDDLTGVKCMAASVAGAAPLYMTMEYPVGTDYQVPVGKIFYITKLDASVTPAADGTFLIGYGDNGTASSSSSSTNFIELTSPYLCRSTDNEVEFSVLLPIPAQKYPCIKQLSGTAANITAYGIEV